MAKPKKKTAKYDLKAADRRRNLLIQIGLTAVVVVFAVALMFYIVTTGEKPNPGEARSVRVASSEVITKEGTTEPKVVLSLYEDALCPACGAFENSFGPTINKLIDTGAVAVDYYMLGILDQAGDGYSSRAGGAAYCVADESVDSFRRFHSALYAPGIQPAEGGGVYPDDARLVELARQAGAVGGVPECINKARYVQMVQGMSAATGVRGTPTVKLNGEEFKRSTPQDLVNKVKEIVGDVPGLEAVTPEAPAVPGLPGAPAPGAPAAPAPAAPAPAAP